jgi:hypothetical protein
MILDIASPKAQTSGSYQTVAASVRMALQKSDGFLRALEITYAVIGLILHDTFVVDVASFV